MLTSKERAQLRAMANQIETIGQIGKEGIDANVIKQVADALEARQLVKYRVLENSALTAREAVQEIAEKTGSDPVQVIGSRFVLYKANRENPLIGGKTKK